MMLPPMMEVGRSAACRDCGDPMLPNESGLGFSPFWLSGACPFAPLLLLNEALLLALLFELPNEELPKDELPNDEPPCEPFCWPPCEFPNDELPNEELPKDEEPKDV